MKKIFSSSTTDVSSKETKHLNSSSYDYVQIRLQYLKHSCEFNISKCLHEFEPTDNFEDYKQLEVKLNTYKSIIYHIDYELTMINIKCKRI